MKIESNNILVNPSTTLCRTDPYDIDLKIDYRPTDTVAGGANVTFLCTSACATFLCTDVHHC